MKIVDKNNEFKIVPVNGGIDGYVVYRQTDEDELGSWRAIGTRLTMQEANELVAEKERK